MLAHREEGTDFTDTQAGWSHTTNIFDFFLRLIAM